jgi:hypothetical protein
VVAGIVTAREELQRLGCATIQIGFNATPSFDPSDDFWPSIGALADGRFYAALDYVGLDFFPDVFRRLAPDGEPGDRRSSVRAVLQAFRERDLPRASIGREVPVHVTENGWPTGLGRTDDEQAVAIETIIRAISDCRTELGIAAYEHFSLRDASSAAPDLAGHFGLLRDDYTPKPAFDVYRRLVSELAV